MRPREFHMQTRELAEVKSLRHFLATLPSAHLHSCITHALYSRTVFDASAESAVRSAANGTYDGQLANTYGGRYEA